MFNNIITTLNRKISIKLPARLTTVVFAFYMSAIMTVLMSTVVTVVNKGITIELPGQIFQAYIMAAPIAFCCVLMVRPVVSFLVSRTVSTEAPAQAGN